MKNLLALFLLVFLTGCVSYYQPESALEDGVYYAADDPSYVYNPDDYSGVVYYPWSTLDYFYFTYGAYPGYGFGYGYPYRYAVWAYPAWAYYSYDYYGYYSPWYSSSYYDPYWRPHHSGCHHHGHCRDNDNNDRDAGDDRYAGDGQQYHGKTGVVDEENAFYSPNSKDKMGHAAGYPPMKRYVSKTANGRTGSEGMAVHNNKPTKFAKSRVEPVHPRSASPITVKPMAAGTPPRPPSAPANNTFSGNNRQSRSFSAPSHPPSSNYGKSSRQKDRD